MADTTKYIPLFLDWARCTEGLSDAEKGRLVDGMVAYANGEDWQNLIRGNERFVLNVFRGQIDRYFDMIETSRDNGSKGGRPKKTGGFDDKKTETVGFSEKPGVLEKNQNKSNSNSNSDNESDSKESTGELRSPTRARARFTPPTVDDVRKYCADSGYRIDAEHFVAYYESNGWRVGKNPMKDWQAAVRTWVRNGYESMGGKTSTQKKVYNDELPWTEGGAK